MGSNNSISYNVYYVKYKLNKIHLTISSYVTRHISCHLRQMLCHSHEFHGLTLRLNFSPIFHNVSPKKAPSNFLALIKYYLASVLLKKLLNISYL